MFIRNLLVVTLKVWEPDRILAECGSPEVDKTIPALRTVRVVVPEGQQPYELLGTLLLHPDVERADYEGRHCAPCLNRSVGSNDTLLNWQWHLAAADVYSAWRHTTGASAVRVAIIDTGVVWQADIPSIPYQYNTVYDIEDCTEYGDPNSHGTFCTGLVFAIRNNGVGVSGVAPQCTPIMVSAYNAAGGGFGNTDLAEAVLWATNHGAKVISMSLGGYLPFINVNGGWWGSALTLVSAIQYAWDHDVVVLAAAGNEGRRLDDDVGLPSDPGYTEWEMPGQMPHVLAIGALTKDLDSGGMLSKAWYSCWGPAVDIFSPADAVGAVGSRNYASYYGNFAGTSAATPITAGTVALIRSVNPALTNQQVVDILMSEIGQPVEILLCASGGCQSAGRAVLKAKSMVPANAGAIYPYINFWGPGVTVTPNLDGTVNHSLNGVVNVDLRAYSSDPITSVEFWAGDNKLYDGPPVTLKYTAVLDGRGTVPTKVVAHTANRVVEETYADIPVSVIGRLWVPGPCTYAPVGGTAVLSGVRTPGSTVVVLGADLDAPQDVILTAPRTSVSRVISDISLSGTEAVPGNLHYKLKSVSAGSAPPEETGGSWMYPQVGAYHQPGPFALSNLLYETVSTGDFELYGWVKDDAGNISERVGPSLVTVQSGVVYDNQYAQGRVVLGVECALLTRGGGVVATMVAYEDSEGTFGYNGNVFAGGQDYAHYVGGYDFDNWVRLEVVNDIATVKISPDGVDWRVSWTGAVGGSPTGSPSFYGFADGSTGVL